MTERSPLTIFANNESVNRSQAVTSLSRSSEAVPISAPESSSKFPGPKSALQMSPNIPTNGSSSKVGGIVATNELLSSPRTSSVGGGSQHASSSSLLKSKPSTFISSSELSSADECSNLGGGGGHKSKLRKRNDTEDFSSDGPLALTKKDRSEKVFMREDSNSASDSNKSGVIMSRSDSSRVRIMEGGFESNEDYTYVRGRGNDRRG
jgi:hypothetical protein